MLPPLAAVSRGLCGQQSPPGAQAGVLKKAAEKGPSLIPDKAENFKAAVESSKQSIERDHLERQKRLEMVETSMPHLEPHEQELLKQEFDAREQRGVVAKFRHWSTAEFNAIAVLGQGSFGTVYLVQQKDDPSQYFALKQMTKVRHSKKNMKRCVYTERDVLSQARNRWFVELFATFQDAHNIFMVMEFLPGGDLFKWIELKNRFSFDETRFYMAELLEALDCLHKHGFIHRDIKFDNMILTPDGHLKLLDFGLCKADPAADVESETPKLGTRAPAKSMVTSKKRQEMATQVGTVYYMAPEVMRGEVSPACDVWAVGVMTYECLYGSPPFHANEEKDEGKRRHLLRQLVINHKKTFPSRMAKAKKFGFIDNDVEQFLMGVICEPSVRLTIPQCREEAFFKSLDFKRLHLMEPPFKPELDGPADLRHFDDFPFKKLPAAEAGCSKQDVSMEWTNYEFDRAAFELTRVEAVKELIEATQEVEVNDGTIIGM